MYLERAADMIFHIINFHCVWLEIICQHMIPNNSFTENGIFFDVILQHRFVLGKPSFDICLSVTESEYDHKNPGYLLTFSFLKKK